MSTSPAPPGELAFVVPGPPQPKERPRTGARGHVYTPRRTSSYEQKVRVHALAAVATCRWQREPGTRYAVALAVYFPDQRRRDLDNACKSILDACNGVAFADDSEVDEVHMVRAVDRERPRVEVSVRRRGGDELPELGGDEARVRDAIARRLAMGRKAYGPLDAQGDRRDWKAEAAEELLDACVYLACEVMRGGKACP